VFGASLLASPDAAGNLVSPLTIYLGYFILGRIADQAGIVGQPSAEVQ
jgi:hypothetical protein